MKKENEEKKKRYIKEGDKNNNQKNDNKTEENKEKDKEKDKTYYKVVRVTPRKFLTDKQEDVDCEKQKLNLKDLSEYITNSDEFLERFDKYDKISEDLEDTKKDLKHAQEEIDKLKDELENLEKEKEKLENENKKLKDKEITFEDLSDEYKEKLIEIIKYSDYKYDIEDKDLNEDYNIYISDGNNNLNEQLHNAKDAINNENKYNYLYHYRLLDNNRKYNLDDIDKETKLNNLMDTKLVIEAKPQI